MTLCDRVQYFKKCLRIVISYRLTSFPSMVISPKYKKNRHFVLYVKFSVAQALYSHKNKSSGEASKHANKQVSFKLVPNSHASSSLYHIFLLGSLRSFTLIQ